MALTHGSLFAGIGGFDLGFERAGFTTLWQVENDPYCQAVLAKHFSDAKRYADIRSVHGVLAHATQQQSHERNSRESTSEKTQTQFRGFCASCLAPVDVLTGGFPCQPFSVAGKRRGLADDRWLWPEMRRVTAEVQPRWVVAENVPGLITLALDQVLSDLEALGYTVGTVTIPACAVDAPHRRERIFILAHTRCQRLEEQKLRFANYPQRPSVPISPQTCPMSTADSRRQSWLPEPTMGQLVDGVSGRLVRFDGRVARGIPNRVSKLKALGNAVVPQVAEALAWMIRRASEAE